MAYIAWSGLTNSIKRDSGSIVPTNQSGSGTKVAKHTGADRLLRIPFVRNARYLLRSLAWTIENGR